MRRRWACLVAVVLLTFVGCGARDESPPNTHPAQVTSDTTGTDTMGTDTASTNPVPPPTEGTP